jgi:hypothetical protein
MKKKSGTSRRKLSKQTLHNLSAWATNGNLNKRALQGGTLTFSLVTGGCTRPTNTCYTEEATISK